MIPFKLLLSLTTASLVLAQDDRQATAGHTFFISHLSPLINYTPSAPTDNAETGWNVSLARHTTTNSNASIEFAYFGNTFDIYGNHSSLDGIDRGLNNDWHEVTVKIDGSDDSFMDIRSYTAGSSVPATTW